MQNSIVVLLVLKQQYCGILAYMRKMKKQKYCHANIKKILLWHFYFYICGISSYTVTYLENIPCANPSQSHTISILVDKAEFSEEFKNVVS